MRNKYLIPLILIAIVLGFVSFKHHYENLISLGLPLLTYFSILVYLKFKTKKDFWKIFEDTFLIFFGIWIIVYTILFNLYSF